MTKQRILGLLLVIAAVFAPLALWALGVNCVEVTPGPTTIIEDSGPGPVQSQVAIERIDLHWNWPAMLFLILLAAVGLACLLVPSRRRNA